MRCNSLCVFSSLFVSSYPESKGCCNLDSKYLFIVMLLTLLYGLHLSSAVAVDEIDGSVVVNYRKVDHADGLSSSEQILD